MNQIQMAKFEAVNSEKKNNIALIEFRKNINDKKHHLRHALCWEIRLKIDCIVFLLVFSCVFLSLNDLVN